MLKELIDFVDSVLPSVPLETKEGVQAAIAQFEREGEQIKYLTLSPLQELSQGDIISSVPFSYFDEKGEEKRFTAEAIVLSTSCHIDQKSELILAPVFPLQEFEKGLVDLKNNKVIDYMYIPDGCLIDKFVDFEIMNTFSKNLIINGINNGRLKRIASLNQFGYYFFIIKLTVYLMRREDAGTLEERRPLGKC